MIKMAGLHRRKHWNCLQPPLRLAILSRRVSILCLSQKKARKDWLACWKTSRKSERWNYLSNIWERCEKKVVTLEILLFGSPTKIAKEWLIFLLKLLSQNIRLYGKSKISHSNFLTICFSKYIFLHPARRCI